jgi:hypothetical protein
LATSIQGLSAPLGLHSRPEPVLILPFAVPGLVRRHHGKSPTRSLVALVE